MKKYLILICLVLLFGCNNDNLSNEEKDYYSLVEKVEDTTKYNKNDEMKIEVNKNDSTYEKNHYEIILSEPKKKYDDLKVLAYPLGYNNDELLPNFNILEKVDITTFNNKQAAIKLNYFSKNEYTKFKVLIQYKENDSIKTKVFLLNIELKKTS